MRLTPSAHRFSQIATATALPLPQSLHLETLSRCGTKKKTPFWRIEVCGTYRKTVEASALRVPLCAFHVVMTTEAQNPPPVSYTHLDVYKRQGFLYLLITGMVTFYLFVSTFPETSEKRNGNSKEFLGGTELSGGNPIVSITWYCRLFLDFRIEPAYSNTESGRMRAREWQFSTSLLIENLFIFRLQHQQDRVLSGFVRHCWL